MPTGHGGGSKLKRALRLIEIIAMLKAKPRTIEELADHFEVTGRTIYRDLADLQSEPCYAPLVRDQVMRIDTFSD